MLTNSCGRAADRLRRRFSRLGHKLRKHEDGQDLIEYSLLTGIIAIVGILVFPTIQSKMADAYQDWNDAAQAIWEPPPPL
jgi:Flp pilus assembly pilin Flp